MRVAGWVTAGVAVVTLAGAGAGRLGPDRPGQEYRVAAVGSARAAHHALATAELTGEAVLAKLVTPPYAETRLSDSRTELGGAADRIDGVGPPDEPCERMHHELRRLLARANAVLSVIEAAVTEQNVADIEPVAQALDAFVRAYRV